MQQSREMETMQQQMPNDASAKAPWMSVHPVSQADAVAAAALRAGVAAFKGKLAGTAARKPFDDVMERVAAPVDVTFEADTVGGIAGLWAKATRAREGAAILHAHGGWFNLGTARAYRNFVGQIASSAGADAFIPEYRLAPEHHFPDAVTDVEACYRGLAARGIKKIAVTGDSAGGDLALVLLSITAGQDYRDGITPVAGVAISPVTDLALTGESYETRADADPFFTKSQVAGLVHSYLGEADPMDPLASALYAELRGLPPIRVHVGDDELLLDDSRRYVERAVAAGVDAELGVWMGMPHGFVAYTREFDAARTALRTIGAFLTERLS
jgi:acetyl esterase/lipase